MPDYTPDQVAQQGDVVYLLSSANRRVYRWSISGGAYLNPWVVGMNQGLSTAAPSRMAYSANHQRLYLGYATGAIRYLDATATNPVEGSLVNMTGGINALTSAGNYLVAQVGTYYSSNTSYVLDSTGTTKAQGGGYYSTVDTAWDGVTSRLYYVANGSSLYYEVIDQATGLISSNGSTNFNNGSAGVAPARVSVDGQSILLGSGDVYAQNLAWSGTLGAPLADARWFANGSLAALTTASGQTQLTRLNGTTFATLEQRSFAGDALRVVGSDTAMVVLTMSNGTVKFYNYAPSNDTDGDGVLNTVDAFPQDAAASLDSDHDGYPDAWNAGKGPSDSTTGLTLDAFPQAAGCWLSAHGSGGVCNPATTVPNYIPDQVAQQGNVVYLLSTANKRVYRWSISGGTYLNPWIVGQNQGLGTAGPARLAYSANHQRLYLGYATGVIRYLDVTATNPVEAKLASMTAGINSLVSAGNFLVAQVGTYYYTDNSYVLDSSGATKAQGGQYTAGSDMTWDPVTSRLYYPNTGYSYALYYEVINQTSGAITSNGTSSANGSSTVSPPARVSVDGAYVLVGNGDFYAQNLTVSGTLGYPVTDARWFADGSLATQVSSGNQTIVRHLKAGSLAVLELKTYTGQALRVVGSDSLMAVLVNDNGTLQIYSYAPSTDTDGDGVLNTRGRIPARRGRLNRHRRGRLSRRLECRQESIRQQQRSEARRFPDRIRMLAGRARQWRRLQLRRHPA